MSEEKPTAAAPSPTGSTGGPAPAGSNAPAPAAPPAAPKKAKKSIIRPPRFEVSSSPHQHSGASVESIMWTVFAALLPAAAVGVYYFGMPGLTVLVTATLGSVAMEAVTQRLMKQPVTALDGSAAVTGLLLGMNLPPAAPLWMILVGCVAAIFIAKHIFGGLGYNPFNPALVARVFLLISFPVQMTSWSAPAPLAAAADAISTASPLGLVKMEILTEGTALSAAKLSILDALVGGIPGSVGETSAIALIIGGLFLISRRIITWHIPVSFLATVAAISTLCNLIDPSRYPGPGFQLVTGGLLIGALFMATDYVTSPVSPRGMLVFGCGCGFLTILIRYWGGYPEGVSFAILLMNLCVPLIDAYTRPRVFGEVKGRA